MVLSYIPRLSAHCMTAGSQAPLNKEWWKPSCRVRSHPAQQLGNTQICLVHWSMYPENIEVLQQEQWLICISNWHPWSYRAYIPQAELSAAFYKSCNGTLPGEVGGRGTALPGCVASGTPLPAPGALAARVWAAGKVALPVPTAEAISFSSQYRPRVGSWSLSGSKRQN